MTTADLRYHAAALQRIERRQWLPLLLLAAWTALAIASVVRPQAAIALYPLVLLVPLALGVAVVVKRPAAGVLLKRAAGWTALVAGAAVAPGVVGGSLVGPAVALLAVCSVAFARFPEAGVVSAFALTAFGGTIEAYTPIPVGTAADVVLLSLWLGAAWMWFLRDSGRPPAVVWPGVIALVLYVAISFFGIVNASSVSNGLLAFRGGAWYMLAFLLVGYAPWPEGTRERIVKGFIVIAAAVGIYATVRWQIGPGTKEALLARQADPTNLVDGQLRLIGSFKTGKALGLWTAGAIPFLVMTALTYRGAWRLLSAVGVATCAIGLLEAEVRTALVGVIAGLVVVLVLYQCARGFPGLHLEATVGALIVTAVLSVGTFAITAAKSESTVQRYTAILHPTEDAAFQARLTKWDTVLADVKHHPFGQGLGSAGRVARDKEGVVNISALNVDNSYLQVAFEQGLFVMVLFVAALVILLYGLLWRAIMTLDRSKAGIAIGVCGAQVSFLLALLTGGIIESLGSLRGWLLVGLGVAQFASRDPDRVP